MKPLWTTATAFLIYAALLLIGIGARANVMISSKPTSNVTCSAGVCSPTAKKAVLNVTDLANMLASGDVTVKSTSLAPDINIDAALSWTSSLRLTLDSYHDIVFNQPLTVAGQGSLIITTNDGGSEGDFSFAGKGHVEFKDLGGGQRGGHLRINGLDYFLVNNIAGLHQEAARGLPVALARNIDNAGRGPYDRPPVARLSNMFEGLGNRISNLTVASSTNSGSVGLIGTSDCCAIRDLGLTFVNIQGTGSQQIVAPLAGLSELGLIKNVYVTGSVSATGSESQAAGLVAVSNGGTLSQTHSDVSVSNPNGLLAGGLVAKYVGSHRIEKSYATGTVTGGDGSIVGGLVADVDNGLILDSYATGSVQGGASAMVGGLVGKNEDDQGPTEVLTSYSTGAVSGGTRATVGGLIGEDLTSGGISDAYWDRDTSGIGNRHRGAGNIPDDPGITGLTDAQLKSSLPAGFDSSIWAQSPSINNGYPYLLANPPQ